MMCISRRSTASRSVREYATKLQIQDASQNASTRDLPPSERSALMALLQATAFVMDLVGW